MLIDIPECKRCMFCVPLRFGILTFGYLNLIFSILVVSCELWLGIIFPVLVPTLSVYRGVHMYTQKWLPILLYVLEIIFNIVLLIGAHMVRSLSSILSILIHTNIINAKVSLFVSPSRLNY
ncbi:uncharacterized protein ACR2FA_007209 [Aphomia sociella]